MSFDEIIAAELELHPSWAWNERSVCAQRCPACWASYAEGSNEGSCRPGCAWSVT